METLALEFQYTEADAVSANIELKRHSKITNALIQVFGVFLLLIAIVFAFAPVFHVQEFVMALGLAVLCISFPALMRWLIRRRFRKDTYANKMIRWTFNENELRNVSEGAELRLSWDKILKVGERKAGFLLFVQPHCAYWIPKNAFKEDREMTDFRGLVAKRGFEFTG